jgi:hypothetical protein
MIPAPAGMMVYEGNELLGRAIGLTVNSVLIWCRDGKLRWREFDVDVSDLDFRFGRHDFLAGTAET